MLAYCRNTVALVCPFDNSFSCAVVPAVKRVNVLIVKASYCRVNAEIIVYPFKLGLISLKILSAVSGRLVFGMSVAVNFLLTGNYVLAVNIAEIIHKSLCFFCGIFVWKSRFNVQFRHFCFGYCNSIIFSIAPAACNFKGVFALVEPYSAEVDICPFVEIRQPFFKLFAVYIDSLQTQSLGCFKLCASEIQVIQTVLRRINGKAETVTSYIDKALSRISRQRFVVDRSPDLHTLGKGQIFTFVAENDVRIFLCCADTRYCWRDCQKQSCRSQGWRHSSGKFFHCEFLLV